MMAQYVTELDRQNSFGVRTHRLPMSKDVTTNESSDEGIIAMREINTPFPKVDRSAFSVSTSFDNTDEKEYWLSRTPQERLQHMELLRRINYGHRATERLQRVLEVAEDFE